VTTDVRPRFSHLPADVCYMDSACQTPRIGR
jgi:hypothetical protein